MGIERPDGPVVEALFAAANTVYVIAPAQIKALRGRYSTAGNKDDGFDAYVLTDRCAPTCYRIDGVET